MSTNREGLGAARQCDFGPGGSVTERLTEWRPNEAIAIEMSDHPWPMANARFRVALVPEGASTRMRQDTEYEFTGDPAAESAVRQQWNDGLTAIAAAFKAYVEGRP